MVLGRRHPRPSLWLPLRPFSIYLGKGVIQNRQKEEENEKDTRTLIFSGWLNSFTARAKPRVG